MMKRAAFGGDRLEVRREDAGEFDVKKVLILANSSGGLYDFRNELVQQLLKDYEVVASLPDTVKTDLLEREGVRVIATPINRRGVNPVQDLELVHNYRRLLQKEQPDVVLTYTIKPNVYGGCECARAGIPYLPTVTGLGSAFEKTGPLLELVRMLYRKGLEKAACVFFQNEENRELFHSMGLVQGRDRLVAGSGVDLSVWQPMEYPQSDVTNFLYVGRIMKEKGIEEFLAAAQALHGEKVVFSLAGYCDEDWQAVLDEKEREGVIVQLGFHPDMHALYEKCSAVVLPTYHEGMSNVLMEASACARPVIASNISGCREVFDEGVTGLGFAPRSSEELILTLRKFLALPVQQRASMGLSARDKMEREFDRRKVAAAYREEIRRICGN